MKNLISYGWARPGTVMALAAALLVASSALSPRLAAQTMAPPLSGGLLAPVLDAYDDEIVAMYPRPEGGLYRLWHRVGDERRGGGSVILSVTPDASPGRQLLQIRPSQPGVSAREGTLAVGPSGELALLYRWWSFNPRAKQVRLARSQDGGVTWTVPDESVDTSGKAFSPQLERGTGRTLLAAWADERRGARFFDIYIRRSTDGGATWEAERLVSQFADATPGDYYYTPVLEGDGQGRFWLVWISYRNGRTLLHMSASADNGKTWSAPEALSGDSASVYGQAIQRAGSTLLLTWEDQRRPERNRIYARVSRDLGATWGPIVEVTGFPPGSPAIAASPGAVLRGPGDMWLVWSDTRNRREDIFVSRSADGATWSPGERVDADTAGVAISRAPRMAALPDGTIGVVWEDDRHGFEAVYGRVHSGDRWGPEMRLSGEGSKRSAQRARITPLGPRTFHVTWQVRDHAAGGAPGSRKIESALLSTPSP